MRVLRGEKREWQTPSQNDKDRKGSQIMQKSPQRKRRSEDAQEASIAQGLAGGKCCTATDSMQLEKEKLVDKKRRSGRDVLCSVPKQEWDRDHPRPGKGEESGEPWDDPVE